MAGGRESEVDRSVNFSVKSGNDSTNCNYCRKNVKDRVQCALCECFFHPSCMTMSARKTGSCEHIAKLETDVLLSQPSKSQPDAVVVELEVGYLKRIICELENRIKDLSENNDLLRFKVNVLEEKLSNATISAKPKLRMKSKPDRKSPNPTVVTSKVTEPIEYGTGDAVKLVAVSAASVLTNGLTGASADRLPLPVSGVSDADGIAPDLSNGSREVARKSAGREAGEVWTVVEKKRVKNSKRAPPIIGDLKSNNSILRSMSRMVFLHVSKLDPETTMEQVIDHLKPSCPGAVCEKLQSRYPSCYSSFKVGIPEESVNLVMTPSCWPCGTRVSKFFRPRLSLSAVK